MCILQHENNVTKMSSDRCISAQHETIDKQIQLVIGKYSGKQLKSPQELVETKAERNCFHTVPKTPARRHTVSTFSKAINMPV